MSSWDLIGESETHLGMTDGRSSKLPCAATSLPTKTTSAPMPSPQSEEPPFRPISLISSPKAITKPVQVESYANPASIVPYSPNSSPHSQYSNSPLHLDSLLALRRVCSKDMSNRIRAETARNSTSTTSFLQLMEKCFSPTPSAGDWQRPTPTNSDESDYFGPNASVSLAQPLAPACNSSEESLDTNLSGSSIALLSCSTISEEELVEQNIHSKILSCSRDQYLQKVRADSAHALGTIGEYMKTGNEQFLPDPAGGRIRKQQVKRVMVNASFPEDYSHYLVGIYQRLQPQPNETCCLSDVVDSLKSCAYFDACGTLLRLTHSYHVERMLDQFHVMRKFRSNLGCAFIKRELEYPEGDSGVVLDCDGSSRQLLLRWLYLGVCYDPRTPLISPRINGMTRKVIVFGSESSSFSIVRKLIIRWFGRNGIDIASPAETLSDDCQLLQTLYSIKATGSRLNLWNSIFESYCEKLESLLAVSYVPHTVTPSFLLSRFEVFAKTYSEDLLPQLGLMTNEDVCPMYDHERFLI